MPEPRYIRFVEVPQDAARKTRRWRVENKTRGELLGVVEWGAWRRYTFLPEWGCEFDALCLRDIAAFLDEQTKAHKTPAQQLNMRLVGS